MAKDKLELQVNIPTKIKLLQADPATGINSYGEWFLYNVECGELEYSYFAPEKVVQILKANNVGKDQVVITKKLVKVGKKNVTDYEVNVLENNTPVQTNNFTNGRTNVASNGNSNGHSMVATNGVHQNAVDTAPAISRDYKMMLQCMTDAMMIRDELGHDVDVNKLGITLFLRKVKP